MSSAALQVGNAPIQQVVGLLPGYDIAIGGVGPRLIDKRSRPIQIGVVARQKIVERDLHGRFDRRKMPRRNLGFEIALLVWRERDCYRHIPKLTRPREIVTAIAMPQPTNE